MPENFSKNEIKEISSPEVENYREIKPEGDMTLEKARDFWDNIFKDATVEDETIQESSKTDGKENFEHRVERSQSEIRPSTQSIEGEKLDKPIKLEKQENAEEAEAEKKQESRENDNKDVNEEKIDPIAEEIDKTIGTPEGIKELIEKHPEKAQQWKDQLKEIEKLNDPEASPVDSRSAQIKLNILKGQIMETATKDALSEAGFDVEPQQRVVEGESGGTRPDVIAVNKTDHPIEVFGTAIQPSETVSIECKCGGSVYMNNELKNHIPNQLSGQEGTKVLLTTSDVKGVPDGLAASVCSKYDAKLVTLDISVTSVENAIKEVSEN